MTPKETIVYEPHDIAKAFPLIGGDDFDALVESVRTHGLLNSIVLHEGKVLDGRNRYAACVTAGVEPTFSEYVGDDPVGFVAAQNLQRRHLADSQRAVIAATLANLRQGDNRFTVGRADPPPGGSVISQARAAKLLGTSVRATQRAARVMRDCEPEKIEAVRDGNITLGEIERECATPPAGVSTTEGKKRIGKGIDLANEAINCLIRIRRNDPDRSRGLQIVADWIRHNK